VATRRDRDRIMQELTVISAHGPYVLVQVAQSAQEAEQSAALAGRLLDLQAPLIDHFQPTDPAHFADLPLDPTGLLARTLPSKPGQGDSTSNATYDPAGELHLEDNPVTAGRAFTDTGVEVVSVSQATVYQTRDPGVRSAWRGCSATTPRNSPHPNPHRRFPGCRRAAACGSTRKADWFPATGVWRPPTDSHSKPSHANWITPTSRWQPNTAFWPGRRVCCQHPEGSAVVHRLTLGSRPPVGFTVSTAAH
jgi:hypothetical protein